MAKTATFPTSGAYVDALQNTRRCFLDAELDGCVIRSDRFGLPRPISGNFASVFTADTASGRRLAVKCFTRDVPDQQSRYREIGAALRDVPASWKVGFRYVDDGMLVEGKPYPVLVMEWIEAEQLIPWIEDRLRTGDRSALGRLAGAFARLAAGLEAAGIAHGDLQHGNLLVTARGELRLIDYDGMYVPALSGRPAMELGQPNYQHPRRIGTDYGPWLDRFSARVIHLSLTALAADPTLWSRLHKPGGEYLLLQKHDLEDPESSAGLAVLGAVNARVRKAADDLAAMVREPLDAISPLDRVVRGRAPGGRAGVGAAADLATKAGRHRGGHPGESIAASDAEAVTGARTQPGTGTGTGAVLADADPGSGSWLDDHLPPVAAVVLPRPARRTRAAWYVSLLFIAAVAAVPAVPGVVVSELAAAVAAALLAGAVLLRWWISFLKLAQVRQRRTCRKAVRAARAQERQHRAQLRWQLAAREESIATYQRELAALADRRAQIDPDAAAEHTAIDRRRDEELTQLIRERSELQDWKNAESARRVEAVEARHLAAELSRHHLDAAQIYGVDRAAVAELNAAGVRTAADFVGVQVEHRFARRPAVCVLHSDGRSLETPAVGEVPARHLAAWRATLAARVGGQAPSQLTAGIRDQLDAEMAIRQTGIAAREQAARSAADVQHRTLRSQTQSRRDAVAADEQSTRSAHAAAVAAIDRDCAAYRDDGAAAQYRLNAAHRALDAYRAVRFRGYLAALTFGRS